MRTDTRRGRCCAGWPATTRRSTRSGSTTRPVRVPLRSPPRPDHPPMVRDADGELAERRGPRRCGRRRGPAGRAAGGSACSTGGGSPSRTPTPTASSPGSRSAPTTSTSGPARTRPRSWTSCRARRRPGPRDARPTRGWRPLPVLCVALEPEEEAPIVFLRAPQARARKHGQNGLPPRAVDHARR
jgi:hypothetical protein